MFGDRDLTARAVIRRSCAGAVCRARLRRGHDPPDRCRRWRVAGSGGASLRQQAGAAGCGRRVCDGSVRGDVRRRDRRSGTVRLRRSAAAIFAELMLSHLLPGSPYRPTFGGCCCPVMPPAGTCFAVARAQPLDDRPMVAAGFLRPGADPPVRSAFLMINDLAAVLLSDHLTAVLGSTLSQGGIRRWAAEVVTAYAKGVFRMEDS